MERQFSYRRVNRIWLLALAVFLVSGSSKVFADKEIEIDMGGDQSQPAAAPAAQPTPVPQAVAAPVPTAQTVQQPPTPVTQVQPQTKNSGSGDIDMDEPTPTPVMGQGILKVKDVYEAGIKSYKQKDYERAIKYLKKAVTMPRDTYTPKYIVAEADATLGVIYQFRIINYKAAYHFYLQALKMDPTTKTAKKHIREVKRHLRKKESN